MPIAFTDHFEFGEENKDINPRFVPRGPKHAFFIQAGHESYASIVLRNVVGLENHFQSRWWESSRRKKNNAMKTKRDAEAEAEGALKTTASA